MGTMGSQKPPGLKFSPQQLQASSPVPWDHPLWNSPSEGTRQEGLSREVGWSGGHCPAFSEGRDGRNLRSATGRHDLNLSHGKVGKGRGGDGGWQPELC